MKKKTKKESTIPWKGPMDSHSVNLKNGYHSVAKEPKCDCADVIGRNQVCDICQGVEESFADGSLIPDQHLKKEHLAKEYHYEGYLKLTEYPPISWELYPFCNDNYLTIRLPKAPNIFYRWMMTLFFGFRWKRIK